MSDEAAINVEELDNMTGGIPELCRRTSQPCAWIILLMFFSCSILLFQFWLFFAFFFIDDYSEKQLEEKTHVPTIETVRVHGDSGD